MNKIDNTYSPPQQQKQQEHQKESELLTPHTHMNLTKFKDT